MVALLSFFNVVTADFCATALYSPGTCIGIGSCPNSCTGVCTGTGFSYSSSGTSGCTNGGVVHVSSYVNVMGIFPGSISCGASPSGFCGLGNGLVNPAVFAACEGQTSCDLRSIGQSLMSQWGSSCGSNTPTITLQFTCVQPNDPSVCYQSGCNGACTSSSYPYCGVQTVTINATNNSPALGYCDPVRYGSGSTAYMYSCQAPPSGYIAGPCTTSAACTAACPSGSSTFGTGTSVNGVYLSSSNPCACMGSSTYQPVCLSLIQSPPPPSPPPPPRPSPPPPSPSSSTPTPTPTPSGSCNTAACSGCTSCAAAQTCASSYYCTGNQYVTNFQCSTVNGVGSWSATCATSTTPTPATSATPSPSSSSFRKHFSIMFILAAAAVAAAI